MTLSSLSKANGPNRSKPTTQPSNNNISLLKISRMIQCTSKEQVQRPKEAREKALAQAAGVASLQFGDTLDAVKSLPRSPQGSAVALVSTSTTTSSSNSSSNTYTSNADTTTANSNRPTTSVLHRNRVVAQALGVQPAMLRKNGNDAFDVRRRPDTTATTSDANDNNKDAFYNEINTIVYPHALLDRACAVPLDAVVKVEKRWTSFLVEATATSLDLPPMKQAMRALVHDYAVYWKLSTASLNADMQTKRRYVHCVKQRTSARKTRGHGENGSLSTPQSTPPHPLLSTVLQTYAMLPISPAARASSSTTGTTSTSIALFSPKSTRQWRRPRGSCATAASRAAAPTETATDDTRVVVAVVPYNGRERPKLELTKRTLPLPLPPLVVGGSLCFKARPKTQPRQSQHDNTPNNGISLFALVDDNDEQDERREPCKSEDDESECYFHGYWAMPYTSSSDEE